MSPLLPDVNLGALGDEADKKIESLTKQINEQNRLISNENRTKIINDASGTPRILFGEGPNEFYGLKVSQEDIDVTGAADSELAFNSNQNVFKIVSTGTTSLTMTDGTSGSTTTVTIPHGLGYIPVVLAFFSDGGVYRPIPNWSVVLSFDTTNDFVKFTAWVDMTVDATNLKFIGYNTSAGESPAYSIKYYLLQETAN